MGNVLVRRGFTRFNIWPCFIEFSEITSLACTEIRPTRFELLERVINKQIEQIRNESQKYKKII